MGVAAAANSNDTVPEAANAASAAAKAARFCWAACPSDRPLGSTITGAPFQSDAAARTSWAR